MLNILTSKTNTIGQTKLNLLVIPVIGKTVLKSLEKSAFKDSLQHHINFADLTDQAGSSVLFYPQDRKFIERILLVQLGKNKNTDASKTIFKAIGSHITKHATTGIVLPTGQEKILSPKILSNAFQNSFRFHEHRTKLEDTDKHKLETLVLFSDKKIESEIKEALIFGEALQILNQLAHRPEYKLPPTTLAEAAEKVGKENKFSVKSLNENDMAKLGMGGILSVSKGSDEEARMVLMDYNPKAKKTIAIIGKGITFDSGGISIKPSKDMHEMKFDMIGGATVIAILQIASALKLPLHIVGIICASENLPSGKATKPGDIVTTYSGKTVEVLNTDAEGRMVLADGIAYAQKHYKPNIIIDIATLTGAVVGALGAKITGAFGNNSKINKDFAKATQDSGEDTHFLPLYTGYSEEIKSSVADLANIGKGAGAIAAALFLYEFIDKKIPWLHLDIAGTAWDKEGPTGVMTHSIIRYLRTLPKR